MKLRKVPVPPSLIRNVYCPLCCSSATLKPTNTLKSMLRCDHCKVLIFANGELSQQPSIYSWHKIEEAYNYGRQLSIDKQVP